MTARSVYYICCLNSVSINVFIHFSRDIRLWLRSNCRSGGMTSGYFWPSILLQRGIHMQEPSASPKIGVQFDTLNFFDSSTYENIFLIARTSDNHICIAGSWQPEAQLS